MDLWLMDHYQNADELTQSLTKTHKAVRMFGKSNIFM